MKKTLLFALGLTLAAGCVNLPEHADATLRGPRGTFGYHVFVESAPAGARIEVNDEYVGVAPTNIVLWGDADGTFHNMGEPYCVVRAYPPTGAAPGLFVQTKAFATGWHGREDMVPKHIFFDLTQPPLTSPNSIEMPPVPAAHTNEPAPVK